MSDLPDRDHITHDDCTEIIAAYQTGRLIDRKAIDYETSLGQVENIVIGLIDRWLDVTDGELIDATKEIVDAALGIKGDTT